MKNQKGFTLIEVFVVLSSILILIVIVHGILKNDHGPRAPTVRAANKNTQLVAPTPVPATPPKDTK